MAKVTVLMNNGKLKEMDEKFAKALVHVRKAILFGDYQKKVMKPEEPEKEDKKNTYKVKSEKTDIDDKAENNQTTKKSSGRPKKNKD